VVKSKVPEVVVIVVVDILGTSLITVTTLSAPVVVLKKLVDPDVVVIVTVDRVVGSS